MSRQGKKIRRAFRAIERSCDLAAAAVPSWTQIVRHLASPVGFGAERVWRLHARAVQAQRTIRRAFGAREGERRLLDAALRRIDRKRLRFIDPDRFADRLRALDAGPDRCPF